MSTFIRHPIFVFCFWSGWMREGNLGFTELYVTKLCYLSSFHTMVIIIFYGLKMYSNIDIHTHTHTDKTK